MADNSGPEPSLWSRVFEAESHVFPTSLELMQLACSLEAARNRDAYIARAEELADEVDLCTREFEELLGRVLAEDDRPDARNLRASATTSCARYRADARQRVAEAFDMVGEFAEAVRRYAVAERLFRELGDEATAQQCKQKSQRSEHDRTGNVDERLRSVGPGTDATDVDGLQRLIETGHAYARGGDIAEARRIFERAAQGLRAAEDRATPLDTTLEELARADAAGDITTADLKDRLARLEQAYLLHNLRQTLTVARAQIARDTEEAEAILEEARRHPSAAGVDLAAVTDALPGVPRMTDGSRELFEFGAALARLDAEIDGRPADWGLTRLGVLRATVDRLGVAKLRAAVGRRQGDLLLRAGRPLDAMAVLREALELLGDTARHDLQPVLLARLAACHAAIGDWPGVSRVTAHGTALVETHRYDVSGTYMKDAYLKDRVGLYRLAVESAYYAKDAERLFRAMELSKARRLASPGVRPDSAQIADIEGLSRLVHRAEPGSPEHRELTLRRRLLWDYVLAGGDTEPPPVPTLEEVQQALLPQEAVLSHYWLDRSRLIVMLLRRNRRVIALRTLPPAARDGIDALCAKLRPAPGGHVPRDIDRPLAAVAPWLLPAAPESLKDCTRLYVSPHGALHALPFHALPWGTGPLIDSVAVTCLPNLSCLRTEVAPPGPGTAVVGIGAFDGERHAARPDLPVEARAIATLHQAAGRPVTPLIDASATHEALTGKDRAAFRQAGCVSFLTHGSSVDADTPMESLLHLYDGPLDGLEISLWPLSGALVTLTACYSGQRAITMAGSGELPGDEVFGLQAAFFAAGASAVLGGLWPLAGADTSRITTLFHEALVDGRQAPDEALRTAVLEFRRTGHLIQRLTSTWAPLFLVSRGRPRPLVPGSAGV